MTGQILWISHWPCGWTMNIAKAAIGMAVGWSRSRRGLSRKLRGGWHHGATGRGRAGCLDHSLNCCCSSAWLFPEPVVPNWYTRKSCSFRSEDMASPGAACRTRPYSQRRGGTWCWMCGWRERGARAPGAQLPPASPRSPTCDAWGVRLAHGILNGRQERPQPGMNYKVLFVFMSCLLYPFLFWFGFGYIIIICQFCSGALHAGPALQGNYWKPLTPHIRTHFAGVCSGKRYLHWILGPFGSIFFFLDCTQVHKCVKASGPSLTSLQLQEGVKELLNLSLSMGSPTNQRSPLKNTSRGVPFSPG